MMRWLRLGRRGKGSAAIAFGAFEDLFAPSRSQARQERQATRQRSQAPPSPEDGPGTGRFAGTVHLPAPPP